MNVGVNCQDGAIFTADAADLKRFASALVICSWTPPTAALNVLASAGVPVGCFRLTESPAAWAGWPGDYVRRCRYLLADNEPDLEGWTSWGPAVAAQWIAAGGLIVEPAWSDERKRTPTPYAVAVVSAHVYPRGLGATNLAACRARANGRPVWITEAGDASAPASILLELAALGVTELAYLYTYRALDQAAQPAYDLAGVALTPPPPPKGPTMRGIDVSSAQTALDWSAIAASGVAFAAIKATEGVGWPSPTFAAQWTGAGAAGLTRIAYHFARCDLAGNRPDTEAAYFVGVVGPLLQPGDLVALDIEVGGGDLSAWALAWLRAVEAALGFRPLCYSYPSFIVASLHDPALAAYPLWYASYQATEPPAPAPWGAITLWQDDDAASVPGVGGLVDGDVTWLAAADLRGLGMPAPAPVQEVDPVIQITPAIQAAARDRYAALGIQPFEGGAIWKEFLARYAVGQANPTHNSILPSPALTPEVTPDATGDAYVLFDDGSIWVWRAAKGQVFTLEEKDRAATRALCGWAGRFA